MVWQNSPETELLFFSRQDVKALQFHVGSFQCIPVFYFTKQNALSQAKQFKEAADITGIVLTKMDGTAKGGIAVAIQSELNIPVKYIGVGEAIDDLQKFDADAFIDALFQTRESREEAGC